MSVVLLGSTSGSVTLQEPAIAGSTVIDLPATSGTMAVLPTATSVLPESSGGTGTTTGYYGFKNRIINGAMVIDQRNAGASVTISTAALNYTLDRWAAFGQATDGIYTVSRSTTVPSSAGFVNSLVATCTTADTSISATNRYFLNQNIEGNNSADLRFGTADAQAITLSFWVRSSLTGTYCAAVLNGGATRAYVAEYTISTADTWEYKTITVPGDTTGTWSTNETTGITLRFALAGGSTYQTTANAWAAGNFNTTTNQVNWMSSSSSRTFYITGVQLEKGSTATSFDYRPYGTELALCMRYYENIQVTQNYYLHNTSSPTMNCTFFFKQDKRTTPTITSTVDQAPTSVSPNISGVFFEKVGGSQGGQFSNVRASAEL